MTAQYSENARNCPVLKLFGPFGQKIDFDTCLVARMVLHPLMGAFLLLAAAFFLLLDGLATRPQLSLPLSIWLWGTTLLLHVGFRAVLDALWAHGQARFGFGRIYQPVLVHIAFVFDVLQFNSQIVLATGHSFDAVFDLWNTLYGYAIIVLGEAFYFTFVTPVLIQRLEAARAAPASDPKPGPGSEPAAAREISVGGERVAIDSLLVLKSRAHHVDIVGDGGALRLRARLIDLVNQMAPGDGVLAHRSHWVARRAIAGFIPGRGAQTDQLVLITGERLKVAGPRREAVRDWARVHRPELLRDAVR
jgi:hypothetical protein